MILDTLAAASKERAGELIKKYGLNALRRKAEALPQVNRGFAQALKKQGLSFICEVKKASPSKGLIAKDFNPVLQARAYEKAGAAAVSCLTEPQYFLGSNEYFKAISQSISLPVLRKDFTVHEAQIYEAKLIGADAILLITALLEESVLRSVLPRHSWSWHSGSLEGGGFGEPCSGGFFHFPGWEHIIFTLFSWAPVRFPYLPPG